MPSIIGGSSTANVGNVDAGYNQNVALTNTPALVGAVRMQSECDPGVITGTVDLKAPETNADYQLRMTAEVRGDSEIFNYTAQNTAKHGTVSTAMTQSWSGGFWTSNASAITTINTGVSLRTYQQFALPPDATAYIVTFAALNAALATNTSIDFGLVSLGAATPFAPTDGVSYRITSAGFEGVVTYNGVAVSTGVLTFAYAPNQVYAFLIIVSAVSTDFYIDNIKYGSVPRPVGNGTAWLSSSLPYSVRHAIGASAAGTALGLKVSGYEISFGGSSTAMPLITQLALQGCMGSQGQSGQTMGTTAIGVGNSSTPAALVPANNTAAAGSLGLGGAVWETDTVAIGTDGIICSFANPVGTIAVPGRSLLVYGMRIDSACQVALTGGGYIELWTAAYGHTAVSLATVEGVLTKAPRRVVLGQRTVAAAAPALTGLGTITIAFVVPIAVQPGEFFAVVKKKTSGTTSSAGVWAHAIQVDAAWVG